MAQNNNNTWRILDTGLRSATENMVLNRTLLEGHQSGITPHTLRFLRFKPSALLGFHQSAEQELNLDYCRDNHIDIQRRITGGGAIYFDQTQLGWELYLNKQALGTADMGVIAQRICEAAADAISELGVDARFRPRNDIEIDGRKVSGTGGAFDGDSILYQGTLLLDFDIEKMLRVLKIPAEKLSDKAITQARDRVVSLAALLGSVPALDSMQSNFIRSFSRAFNVEFYRADGLNQAEMALYERIFPAVASDEWIYQYDLPASDAPLLEGIYKSSGGLLRVRAVVDDLKQRIKQIWITGDVFVQPKRLIVDLEAALKDTSIDQLRSNIETFFAQTSAEMLLLTPGDFVIAIERALGERVCAEALSSETA